MFNLFLLLLLLMVETPKIELQPVQQEIVQIAQPDKIADIGYVKRPINQRTQVRNVYLDGATYDWQKSILSASWNSLDGFISRTSIGNYDFDYTYWFVIPTDWTYMVTVTSFVGWFVVPTSWLVTINITHRLKNNTLVNLVPISVPREACDWGWNAWTYIYAFKQWDTIGFGAQNDTDQTLTIRITATITKLS